MAKFKFPLETVLRHRTHIEQEKQRDLARFQADMQQHQASLQQIDQTVQGSMDDLRQNRLLGKLDVGFLTGHRRHMLAVQRQATTLLQRMSLLQRQIDDAQQALAEAAKQRKIMEKLRERQKARWQADQARRELAELDDVTMRMTAASMMQAGEAEGGGAD
jgi:flagellar FliJ protein